MNAIQYMEDKKIGLFKSVVYNHADPRIGSVDCIVTQIKSGGVMLRSIDTKDKAFLLRGENLERIIPK